MALLISRLATHDKEYSRKEKSLGELCKRFLVLYGRELPDLLYLDSCTAELDVERRRIYDIINILESFFVIKRQAKNAYEWKGIHQIVESIANQIVRTLTLQKQHSLRVAEKGRVSPLRKSLSLKENLKVQIQNKPPTEPVKAPEFDSESSDSLELCSTKTFRNCARNKKAPTEKKEKSLGLLCQQFIGLFVTWKRTISLEEAALRISNRNIEEQKLKTKIRRLYDIANVLQSIGLIQKTNTKHKKPAFEWVGIEGVKAFVRELVENDNYLSHKHQPRQKSVFSVQRSSSTCEESQLCDFPEQAAKAPLDDQAQLNYMLEEALKDKTQVALNQPHSHPGTKRRPVESLTSSFEFQVPQSKRERKIDFQDLLSEKRDLGLNLLLMASEALESEQLLSFSPAVLLH